MSLAYQSPTVYGQWYLNEPINLTNWASVKSNTVHRPSYCYRVMKGFLQLTQYAFIFQNNHVISQRMTSIFFPVESRHLPQWISNISSQQNLCISSQWSQVFLLVEPRHLHSIKSRHIFQWLSGITQCNLGIFPHCSPGILPYCSPGILP